MEPLVIKEPQFDAPQAVSDSRTNLVGIGKEEMKGFVTSVGLEPFRAKQLWRWIYKRGMTEFDVMSDMGKQARELLEQHCFIERGERTSDQLSKDGTRKWLLKFADGNEIETVYIPEAERGTLCISSQVGCTLACTFCHTGTQRLVRNLTAAEIVGQVLAANDAMEEWPINPETRKITNIVFMGMGEPLFNYEHVKTACKLLTDGEGLSLSRKKVTVSTSGVVPEIYKLADEVGVNLALSLHAVHDDLRDEIVPINRKYKLKEVMEACHYYAAKYPSQRILIEYVMLAGVNDSDADAHALIALLQGLPVKVNLIPFNPWPGSPYECSSNNRIHKFAQILADAHISVPIRKTRGQDILAACGQLKSASERKKGQKVKLS